MFLGTEESIRGKNMLEEAVPYKIVYISPIVFSESKQWQLMIVTKNGYRVYLSFSSVEAIEPTEEEIENAGAQSSFLVLERITNEWRVAEIMKFPNEEAAIDTNFMNSLMNGLFRVHTLNAFYEGTNLTQHVIAYNNFNSTLIYGQNRLESDKIEDYNPDEPNLGLRINFIKKNESSFTHYKQLVMNKLKF